MENLLKNQYSLTSKSKAKWTYSDEDKIEGYDIGVKEGNEIMVQHMETL